MVISPFYMLLVQFISLLMKIFVSVFLRVIGLEFLISLSSFGTWYLVWSGLESGVLNCSGTYLILHCAIIIVFMY